MLSTSQKPRLNIKVGNVFNSVVSAYRLRQSNLGVRAIKNLRFASIDIPYTMTQNGNKISSCLVTHEKCSFHANQVRFQSALF